MSGRRVWHRAGAATMILTVSIGLANVPVHGAVAAGTHAQSRNDPALPAAAHHLTSWKGLPAGLAPALRRALARDAMAHSTTGGSAAMAALPGTTWKQQQELTGSASGDNFGYSVSISGTTALIGAPLANGGARGTAYVFVRSGSTWSQQAQLTPADPTPGSYFGWAVSLSGDTAVIGAPQKNGATGAVYVFVRSGTTWSQQAELTATHAPPHSDLGWSVAVSGATIVAGTYSSTPGAAYVFVRKGTSWVPEQELTASDGVTGDRFGWSVTLSGNTALIGAYAKNNDSGAAYIFTRSGTTWSQTQEITDTSGAIYGEFGYAVALSGATALISEPGTNHSTGLAYIYTNNSGTWTQQAMLSATGGTIDTDFGNAVALSGPTAVIGAYYGNNQTGAAYVFTRSGTTWTQQAQLAPSDIGRGSYYGCSVGVTGGTALIGAERNRGGTGAAYVFVRG